MDALREFLVELRGLDVQLFHLGEAEITLFGLVKFTLLFFALISLTRWFDRRLMQRMLARTEFDAGARVTIAAIARYAFLLLGFLVIVQTSGIDLTSLNVLAGAVGVGVGFGLQNIVSNFVSGLIIMFERSVKVGDHVVMATIEGTVTEVGARRTIVLTNDNIHYIVPNTRFITENVANLGYGLESRVRVRVPVNIAAGPAPEEVSRLLLEAATETPGVLTQPEPQARLAAYQGGGGMAFELLAWNSDRIGAREMLVSELNFRIGAKLRQHDIKLA